MVIKRKNITPSGFLEVESDNTDTVDVGGFSDAIQVVSAKTAKFSGGSTMKANTGLRIGTTQLKINTTDATPGVRTEVAADFIIFPANGNTVDDNETTFSSSGSSGGEAVIDYGSVAIRDIKLVTRMQYVQPEFGSTGAMTMVYQISNDNITYTDPVTSNPTFQTLPVTPGGDMMGGGTINSGIVTYNDPNSQSFRYVKITLTFSGTASNPTWFIYQVTEQDTITNQVTVRVRSSATQDTADGSVIIPNQIMDENQTLIFDTDLLLTGDGEFVTLEIVSLTSFDIPVTLSEITSIKEV